MADLVSGNLKEERRCSLGLTGALEWPSASTRNLLNRLSRKDSRGFHRVLLAARRHKRTHGQSIVLVVGEKSLLHDLTDRRQQSLPAIKVGELLLRT